MNQNHFKILEEEHRLETNAQIKSWLEFLKSDKSYRRTVVVFYNKKIKEYQQYLVDLNQRLNKYAVLYANEIDEEKKSWYLWRLERDKDFKEAIQKKIKKFAFEIKVIQGKVDKNTLDIKKAKEYPIGDLLNISPQNSSPGRKTYLCPLHNEKTGSFTWYMNNNSWYCFGCGEWGDVIDLFMKLNNVSFKEAVKMLS